MEVEPGKHYQHTKTGKLYLALMVARAEANLERVVVYREVDPGTGELLVGEEHAWVRSAEKFCDGRFQPV